jgi:glucose-1-phosphate adenylyltransferase
MPKQWVSRIFLGFYVSIETNAQIRRCIIDKNVRVLAGETISVDRAKDAERLTISEQGIVVVPESYRF